MQNTEAKNVYDLQEKNASFVVILSQRRMKQQGANEQIAQLAEIAWRQQCGDVLNVAGSTGTVQNYGLWPILCCSEGRLIRACLNGEQDDFIHSAIFPYGP